jgi:hypothetical protein
MNTSSQILAIINDHPLLHIWGNGTTRGASIDYPAAREELLRPANLVQVIAAADWCGQNLDPAPGTCGASTFYWKHLYESHAGKDIQNGAFAIAAALAGLPMDWALYNPTIHARARQHPIGGRHG